jgi:hypothetical protein
MRNDYCQVTAYASKPSPAYKGNARSLRRVEPGAFLNNQLRLVAIRLKIKDRSKDIAQ